MPYAFHRRDIRRRSCQGRILPTQAPGEMNIRGLGTAVLDNGMILHSRGDQDHALAVLWGFDLGELLQHQSLSKMALRTRILQAARYSWGLDVEVHSSGALMAKNNIQPKEKFNL